MEFEKLFAGAGGGGVTDGGTFQRMYGTWLTWTQSRKGDVFVVATTNSVTTIPAPALRKGRLTQKSSRPKTLQIAGNSSRFLVLTRTRNCAVDSGNSLCTVRSQKHWTIRSQGPTRGKVQRLNGGGRESKIKSKPRGNTVETNS